MTYVSVNAWVKRYNESGQGRKPILNKQTDKESVLQSIKAYRQRIQTAKTEWEENLVNPSA